MEKKKKEKKKAWSTFAHLMHCRIKQRAKFSLPCEQPVARVSGVCYNEHRTQYAAPGASCQKTSQGLRHKSLRSVSFFSFPSFWEKWRRGAVGWGGALAPDKMQNAIFSTLYEVAYP